MYKYKLNKYKTITIQGVEHFYILLSKKEKERNSYSCFGTTLMVHTLDSAINFKERCHSFIFLEKIEDIYRKLKGCKANTPEHLIMGTKP